MDEGKLDEKQIGTRSSSPAVDRSHDMFGERKHLEHILAVFELHQPLDAPGLVRRPGNKFAKPSHKAVKAFDVRIRECSQRPRHREGFHA